jgi:tetratricopeptide (TPR) repeat protein
LFFGFTPIDLGAFCKELSAVFGYTFKVLKSLGELRLEDSSFKREKPLLLLAYLALEGAKPRRFIADLFWTDAKDPLNSLSVAISKLRGLGVVEADERRAWTTIECDAAQLRTRLRERQFEAVSEYHGPFLDGLIEPVGAELEEWIFGMRETIALEIRAAMVQLAERAAAIGSFSSAAKHANAALELKEAPPFEPEELARLHRVLVAAGDPQSATVRREAEDFGLDLNETPEAARDHLRPAFIARTKELETLNALTPGQWAWVRGGIGMGKTVLLQELERLGWRYTPARSGLPFATLEGLVDIGDGESAIVGRLAKLEGRFAFDGWEAMDAETRDALTRLRSLNPPSLRIIIASRLEPSISNNRYIELGALAPDSLTGQVGAFEITGGHPTLVGAWMRNESLDAALESQLTALPPEARRTYAALTLLEPPDLGIIRRAVNVDGATFARALQNLIDAGLIEPSGAIRTASTAQTHLSARPMLESEMALGIARALGHDTRALPLYQKARAMWEDTDEAKIQQAYIVWAQELIKRGFPARAAEMLIDAPQSDEIIYLAAKALEICGKYKVASEEIMKIKSRSPSVDALHSKILWRLGKLKIARSYAQKALQGSTEARAESLNTLGSIEFLQGNYKKAADYFQRSKTLWSAENNQEKWAAAINNYARAKNELGENVDSIFDEALEGLKNNNKMRASVLLNKAYIFELKSNFEAAENIYQEIIELCEGDVRSAMAYLNLGAMHHRNGKMHVARDSYNNALTIAQPTGDLLLIAKILSNLGELNLDLPMLREAIYLFEASDNLSSLELTKKIYIDIKGQLERSTLVQG